MNIIQTLDNNLSLERINESEHQSYGKFRPSMYGQCFRKQYLARIGEQETNPPDAHSLRRFKIGTMFHNMIQGYLPKDSIEVEFENEFEKGHCDYVAEDRCIDIKTVRAFGFQKMLKKDYDITTEKTGYILQVVRYAMAFRKPFAELVFFDVDSCMSNIDKDLPFIFPVSDWESKVIEEIEILKGFWVKQQLPPAMPRSVGWCECKWSSGCCGYYDYCQKEKGVTNGTITTEQK